MRNESKREKFLFWLIKNSHKWWLWLPVIIVASLLASTGAGGIVGLGMSLWGALTFAAGINLALEALFGDDWAAKDMWRKKCKG